MRFKRLLNEYNGTTLGQEHLDDIEKRCMPFLKDARKVINREWWGLFRGFQRDMGDFSYKKPRSDRRPTDSTWEWHNALNHAFRDKFGVNVRSEGVFCKIKTPTGYGIDSMVFPIGSYYCIWSEVVDDAYHWTPKNSNGVKHDDVDRLDIEAREMVVTYKKSGINGTVRGLLTKDAVKHEVALICKAYYVVDVKYRDQLQEWIKNEI